ncbi:MAG: AAA family ATPase [Planctomycetota bacterium]
MIPQLNPTSVPQGAIPGNPGAASGKFKPVDPMRFVRKYMWVLIIAGTLGLGMGIGLRFTLAYTSAYFTSIAQMIVSGQADDPWIRPGTESELDATAVEFAVATEIARMQSEPVLRSVLDRQEVRDTEWYASIKTTEDRIAGLRDDVLMITPRRDSAIINLAAETRKGDDSRTILNNLIAVYTDLLRQESEGNNRDNRQVYQQEINRADDTIRLLQERVSAFTQTNEIDSLDARYSQASIRYRDLSATMSQLELALASARSQAATIMEQVEAGTYAPSLDERLAVENLPLVMGHSQRIQSLKEQRTMMDELGSPNSYTARRLDAQISAAQIERDLEINRQLEKLSQQRVQGAESAVKAIEGQIDSLREKVEAANRSVVDLNATLARYDQLQDDLRAQQTVRDRSQKALDTLRMRGEMPNAVRVETLVAPQSANMSFPPSLTVLGGAGMIFMLGCVGGLLFVREMLDQRFTSPADISLLPNADLLATLPHAAEDPSGLADVTCIVQRAPNGLLAESYRQLRTDLLARVDRRGYRTVLIVGSSAESGATTVVQNLGLSLANNARSVLLIDANLRRPTLPNSLGAPATPGLADYLNDGASADKVVHTMSDLPLSVLPCGTDPSRLTAEAFESKQFRELLSKLESEFDIVLIDCPPALLTSEAQILAKHVDAAVVVTRANRDKRGMTGRVIRKIDGQRADLLGVVLNGVRSAAGGYFRKNFRDFYRYSQQGRPAPAQPLQRSEPQATTTAAND